MLFLASLRIVNYISSYPIKLAAISMHGKNVVTESDRTHWDYSYATFISEVISKGNPVPNIYQDYLINKKNTIENNSYLEFLSFQSGLIWNYLGKYRSLKRKAIKFFRKLKK